MKNAFLALIFIFAAPLYGATVCKEVPTSGWTQEQKNLRQAIFYQVAFSLGDNNVPKVQGDRVCFDNPSFNVNLEINQSTFTARYNELVAKNTAETSRLSSLRTQWNNLKAQLKADYRNIDSYNAAQTKAAVKRIIRFMRLEIILREALADNE